ncbi:hypothetical protein NDU88_001283 [Pleurodeles waltl]|uniref:Uncharacterized protein n=1 Tax=Pleurodeles waltl TaxID=8319 RepID=A0AAV7UUW5_PLEWA|nr:hypothetical protein NDU88_001283 [Pleurodeles waltl]
MVDTPPASAVTTRAGEPSSRGARLLAAACRKSPAWRRTRPQLCHSFTEGRGPDKTAEGTPTSAAPRSSPLLDGATREPITAPQQPRSSPAAPSVLPRLQPSRPPAGPGTSPTPPGTKSAE